MNDANLVATAHAAFNPYVLEQLSSRIGLPADMIRQVEERAASGILLVLMASAHSADSTRRMFDVIVSAESNARIAAQLAGLIASSHGLKSVERAGHALMTRIVDSRDLAAISDLIAAQTGVPPQAAHALTDVVSALVLGVVKHHLLLEQGNADGLPELFAAQWPTAAPWLAEGYAKALGFESSAAYADTVPQRLGELAAAMQREGAGAAAGRAAGSAGWAASTPPGASAVPAIPAVGEYEPAAGARAAPAQLLSTAEPIAASTRRFPAWVAVVAVLIVLLAGVIVYGYRQHNAQDDESALRANSSTSGVLAAVPASAASTTMAAAASSVTQAAPDSSVSDAASGTAAASEPAAASIGGSPVSEAKPATAASQ